jgi:hypothetical protein
MIHCGEKIEDLRPVLHMFFGNFALVILIMVISSAIQGMVRENTKELANSALPLPLVNFYRISKDREVIARLSVPATMVRFH